MPDMPDVPDMLELPMLPLPMLVPVLVLPRPDWPMPLGSMPGDMPEVDELPVRSDWRGKGVLSMLSLQAGFSDEKFTLEPVAGPAVRHGRRQP